MAIRKVCCRPGCDVLADVGDAHCAEHKAERDEGRRRARERAKLGAAAQAGVLLYATKAWKNLRRAILKRHPLCVDCGELGLVVEAREVDHIEPHRGDRAMFFDPHNLQALCKSCHSRKTAREVLNGGGSPKITPPSP